MESQKQFPDEDDSQTDTQNSVKPVIYSSPWIRKSYMKNISNKTPKNNISIVNRLDNPSSWCSTKSQISNDELQLNKHLHSSHSILQNSLITNAQSVDIPLKSFSSSDYTSSDDLLYNNPFINKLKNPSIDQKIRPLFDTSNTYTTNHNNNIQSFFPVKTATNSSSSTDSSESQQEERKEPKVVDEDSKYRHFEHRFHWTENIEHGSPWVRHRSKEIIDNVNGSFKVPGPEIIENDSEDVTHDSNADDACENCSETDDNITYDMASKLCDLLIKDEETNTSEDQCECDAQYKWTNLYYKLVKHGYII